MIKFRWYFDKDAETKWLNVMSEKGWAMKKFFVGIYSFERCEPGKYIYQVDFGDKLYSVSDEYREFMQDTGVEIVQTWGYWIILRKSASDGEFKLYTDVDSSIEHYFKIRRMFKGVIIVELICFFMEIFAGANGFPAGYALAFLIGALMLGMVNTVSKTNNIINDLRERRGETVSERSKNISMLLPCGLLLNSCAIIISDSVPQSIKLTIQVIAILVMMIGIYLTGKNRCNDIKK